MEKSKILIVDDEKIIRCLIIDILTPLGYEVIQACDGIEAIEIVEKCKPDVILLDVTMPRMDGFQVLKKLKENDETKTIPIIMVTSFKEIRMRVKAIELGVDDFLSKPMDIIELRARVKSLIKVKSYNDYMINYQKKLESEVTKRTEEVQSAIEKAKDASYETILILSRAAEYRDTDTGAHILRVSHYAEEITRKLGKSDEEVEAVLYGAPMHDVGKIGIPDSILLKPGKLTDDEFKIMQEHVNIGVHILEGSNSEFIKKGEEIALSHHEKWNGKGYPQCLKGKNIPFSGRVIAVADVFDALTTQRPYKEPFPIEKSKNIIKSGRSSDFDPAVVDAFFAVFDQILQIKDKYKDSKEIHNKSLNSIGFCKLYN